MFIINWVKRNKLATLLLLIVVFFFSQNILNSIFGFSYKTSSYMSDIDGRGYAGMSNPMLGKRVTDEYRSSNYQSSISSPAPQVDVKSRMIIQESHMSLLVKDVANTLLTIKTKVIELGGYMVESNFTKPEEAASGQITIRVPQDKLDETLKSLRVLAVKVVSENLKGSDVTDQFVDNESRLKILERNKARFEEIMSKAEKIDEVLRVQQEIFNLQNQIDSIKGQQEYLSKSSQLVKINIYLSTDELALPYAPAESWRPEVVFKFSVRSLLSTLQKLGSLVIWLVVYSVIWLPILVLIIYLRRRKISQKISL